MALVQVLWHELYRKDLSVIPFDPLDCQPPYDAAAVLWVDRDLPESPAEEFDAQLDPVGLWYEMTGLPFVFCVWAAQPEADCPRLQQHLRVLQQAGLWRNRFDGGVFTEAHQEGLEEFLDRAAECGLIDRPAVLRYCDLAFV